MNNRSAAHGYAGCDPSMPARNLVSGTIANITPWGVQARVLIDSGMSLTALVTWLSIEELGRQPGQQVLVAFKASAVHVIHHHEPGSEAVDKPET
jgi:molybdopterin-binding protein